MDETKDGGFYAQLSEDGKFMPLYVKRATVDGSWVGLRCTVQGAMVNVILTIDHAKEEILVDSCAPSSVVRDFTIEDARRLKFALYWKVEVAYKHRIGYVVIARLPAQGRAWFFLNGVLTDYQIEEESTGNGQVLFRVRWLTGSVQNVETFRKGAYTVGRKIVAFSEAGHDFGFWVDDVGNLRVTKLPG